MAVPIGGGQRTPMRPTAAPKPIARPEPPKAMAPPKPAPSPHLSNPQFAPNTPGTMSTGAIEQMWDKEGGPKDAAGNMARIAQAESSDVPSVVQKGQPPGLTGLGLYQVTPTSGITQNGQFGNLLNAQNNTKAAISVFDKQGYHAFTDPVGLNLPGGPGH